MSSNSHQSIPNFFSGKSIFLTGATGFLGKILLEKLLRSCQDLDKIYIIIRPKKGVGIEERLQKLTNLELFDKLKDEHPGFIEEKIIPLEGDVSMLNLGLSEKDQQLLLDNVSVVFHAAASVRFDDPLKDAIIINTRGTREVVNLALKMKQLSVFVHVSTTYCNCDRKVVKEQLYPPHSDWRTSIEIAESTDRYVLEMMQPKYMNGMPNTYTFTKSMAEHVVYDLCKDKIPAVIFRPAIVIATLEDPVFGWIDNFNGPVGVLIACGKGVLRTGYSDPKAIGDYIPADCTIRGVILAAWKKATTQNLNDKLDVSVYNCINKEFSTEMETLLDMGKEVAWKMPLNNRLWYSCGGVTKCKYWYYTNFYLLHLIPALLVDTVLKVAKKRPINLFKLQRKIFSASASLSYFTLKEWDFVNENFRSLDEALLPEDKTDFSCFAKGVDKEQYMFKVAVGARKYLLHEDHIPIEKGLAETRRLYVIHIFVLGTFYLFSLWFIFFKVDIISLVMKMFHNYFS